MSRVTKKSLEDVEAGDWVYETNPDTRSHPEMSAPPYTESFEMFVEVPVLSADEKTITTENGTYKRRNGRVVIRLSPFWRPPSWKVPSRWSGCGGDRRRGCGTRNRTRRLVLP